MRNLITTLGRVLAQHWPALLAWFLAGRLAHYILLEVASYVGAWTATGGLLLLPLAVLVRLISLVAMFLIVRDALRQLSAIAPPPETPAERRHTFLTTLLASILPFFAIYAAWGMLRDDEQSYAIRSLAIRSGISLQAAVNGGAAPTASGGTLVEFDAITAGIILVTFAGRWAWKKWPKKLPAPFSIVAVYFEAVWVCLSVDLVTEGVGTVTEWVNTRVGVQWIAQLREWLDAQLAPVAWIWDGITWFIGELAGLTIEPLAWLAIAGVIYGQAIAAEKPAIDNVLFRRAGERYAKVPSMLRQMLGNLVSEFTSRFQPIVDAIVLMWRAGPLLIGSFVLMYVVVIAGQNTLALWLSRLIGPHDLDYWRIIDVLLMLGIAAIIEPLRIAVVAAAYDSSLGTLRAKRSVAGSGGHTIVGAGDQGSTENLANTGVADDGTTSTQNGPSASSGTRNGMTSS